MENIKNINPSPIYKLYELNFRDIYFFDKITKVNSSKSKTIKNHRNINKYKNLSLNGKTQDLSERNKSSLISNNKNFYSLIKLFNKINLN